MDIQTINAARSLAASKNPARESDRAIVLAHYPVLADYLTSAEQYQSIGLANADPTAVALIGAGLEPHLIRMDSLETGTDPFITVFVAMTERQPVGIGRKKHSREEFIGLELHSGLGLFRPDTLIAWRAT